MSILEVCRYPDPVLREVCRPIATNEDCEILIFDMIDTLRKSTGLGLAASQVGKLLRIVVMRHIAEPGKIRVLINPEIRSVKGEIKQDEGCLSIPGYRTRIQRHSEITYSYLDRGGHRIEAEEAGLLAVVIQHEIDHLNGKLFIDYLGPVSREMFKTKWKKLQRSTSKRPQ
jgi:peptide deformylase